MSSTLGLFVLAMSSAAAPSSEFTDTGAVLRLRHESVDIGETTADALTLRAAAFAAMWRVMPLTMPLGHLARIPPVLWGLERLYRVFLRVRPRLQRLFNEKPEHAST